MVNFVSLLAVFLVGAVTGLGTGLWVALSALRKAKAYHDKAKAYVEKINAELARHETDVLGAIEEAIAKMRGDSKPTS